LSLPANDLDHNKTLEFIVSDETGHGLRPRLFARLDDTGTFHVNFRYRVDMGDVIEAFLRDAFVPGTGCTTRDSLIEWKHRFDFLYISVVPCHRLVLSGKQNSYSEERHRKSVNCK
jgi:hypothetical protein